MTSSLADLLKAWKRLRIEDAATRARVAALLGFGERASVTAGTVSPAPPDPTRRAPSPPPLPPSVPQHVEGRRTIEVHELSQRPAPPQNVVLQSETMGATSGLEPVRAKAPLLTPQWQRGVFSALLSRPFATGEVDSTALLETLSQGRIVRRIPWRTVPSLALGVRCFFDAGVVMHPFLEDQAQLIAGLRRTLGQDRVVIGYFERLPDSPGVRFDDESDAVALPDAPILIVSDFGVIEAPGRRWALPEEWSDYIRRERQLGASAVFALSPLGRARVPRVIRNEVVVLDWDRTLSVRSVLREKGRRGAL